MAFKMKNPSVMKMAKEAGSAMKMKKAEPMKFNAGLRKASAEGKLDNNPKFKAAVDNAPKKLKKTPMQMKKAAMKLKDEAMKLKEKSAMMMKKAAMKLKKEDDAAMKIVGKRTVTKGEDGSKTVTRTNRKGVVRKTKTKRTEDNFLGTRKIKDKQTQSRDGSKVRIKTKTRTKNESLKGKVKQKTKGVLSNFKGTDDYKTVKAKSSRRVSTGIKPGKKRTSKSTQNTQASQILRSQEGFRSYKRPTTGKRAT